MLVQLTGSLARLAWLAASKAAICLCVRAPCHFRPISDQIQIALGVGVPLQIPREAVVQ